MSGDLNLYTNSRKYIRAQVTKYHNDKSALSSKSTSDKHALKAKFESYLKDLKEYNSNIQSLKWQKEQDTDKLNDEMAACESYTDKINEMLALLEDNVPATSTLEAARSLLKSPTAPLPIFKSGEGENIEKFLTEFEDTTTSFQLKDRDKLLLLKQQVFRSCIYSIKFTRGG